MPSDYFDLPPINNRPKPDFGVWLRMRQYFLDQRATLVKLHEDKGEIEAELARGEMLEGLDIKDIKAWEQMFAEGKWQYPHAQEMVEEARTALGRFLGDIVTPQEEAMKELRHIKSALFSVLMQLVKGEPMRPPVDLNIIFKRVERFETLSGSSEEMNNLINQILLVIKRVANLMK